MSTYGECRRFLGAKMSTVREEVGEVREKEEAVGRELVVVVEEAVATL